MDFSPICESGNATMVLQEPFSMVFKFADFDVIEAYTMDLGDNGNIRRKITFNNRKSPSQVIGQSINFPSSWRVNIQCKETHARVSLEFHEHFRDGALSEGSNGHNYAIVKFRIIIVDKDSDLLYAKRWQSWECPKRVYLKEEYAMMDFISLNELFESQDLLVQNKTLRLLCEGVLYSGFVQFPINFGKHYRFHTVSKPQLLENGEHSDVQLVPETGIGHKAHKIVLSNASPVLRSLTLQLTNNGNDGIPSLKLRELTESEISKMLQYIYTGNIKLQDWDNYAEVEKLIIIAKNYELTGMKYLCYKNLISTISLNKFREIAKLFQKNSADETLRAMLYRFYIKNQEKLIQMDSFKAFASEDKDAFLYVVLFSSGRDP